MIPNLDNTASEIVQYQRDSTVQRKDLAQKTKDFRKLDDSAKLGEIKGLLKGGFRVQCDGDSTAHTNFSIPNLYRPSNEPLQIHEFGILTSLLVTVGGTRSISLTRGIGGFATTV